MGFCEWLDRALTPNSAYISRFDDLARYLLLRSPDHREEEVRNAVDSLGIRILANQKAWILEFFDNQKWLTADERRYLETGESWPY